ncbi:MAG: MarR family transcriptional regulator [Acidimicrobiia bacterium]
MSQEIRLSREQRTDALRRLEESLRGAQTASDLMDDAFCDFIGVNRTDGRCLDIVDQRGPMTAGDLAREVGLTTGAATTMVDRLVTAGLLERSGDPHDRRKVLVALTPEAKRLAAEVYGPMAEASSPYVEALSDQDLLTIIRFLETSRRLNQELAGRVRARVPRRKASLRYRLEQAKVLKDDAKSLFKTIKSEMKDLVSIAMVVGGTRWVQDEHGRWQEIKD